jgi:hypothetical protein
MFPANRRSTVKTRESKSREFFELLDQKHVFGGALRNGVPTFFTPQTSAIAQKMPVYPKIMIYAQKLSKKATRKIADPFCGAASFWAH